MKLRTLSFTLLAPLTSFLLSGCQLPYLAKSAYSQLSLLSQRQPLEQVVSDPELDPKKKRKLQLALSAREFAEESLKLHSTKNYTSYVELDRPYVSWILRVSPKYKLEHYLWNYPVIGKMPYKGFFDKSDAVNEAKKFPESDYDTYVRGVTAYSTLGWFNDPILSSMLGYSDHDLVNLIIHETVHATIFIDGQADFNERLATFIANQGTHLFYLEKEGPESATLKQIQLENKDTQIFSDFISQEIKSLRKWYQQNEGQLSLEKKQQRLAEIKKRFANDIQPRLKTSQFDYFKDFTLNNASLLSYETYFVDLSNFEKLFVHLENDFSALLAYCKNLENSENPQQELETFVSQSADKNNKEE